MATKHFEELWVEAENIKDTNSSEEVLKQLELKFALFRAILMKKDSLSINDYNESVERLFGEVLFSLSQLSMIENVNVFSALDKSMKLKLIDLISKDS